jgi:ketosteroid isomerase-like protein
MSRMLVSKLRSIYGEWAQGNFRAGLELLDPGIVFETFTGDEGSVRARGLTELQERMRQTFGLVWSEFTVEAEDYVDVGDKIVVVGRMRGRGRGSGVEVHGPVFMVWTFRDGRAVRQQWFAQRSEALEAAGLTEEASPQEKGEADRTPLETDLRWAEVMRRRLE